MGAVGRGGGGEGENDCALVEKVGSPELKIDAKLTCGYIIKSSLFDAQLKFSSTKLNFI
jgi:hypothetical protein